MIKNACIVAALLLAPAAASAAIITNGDFEAGLTGWTSTGTVNAVLGAAYADGIGTVATPAQRANTYAFFGGGNVTSLNTLSQSFTTIVGKSYDYSFDVLAVGSGSQAIDYSFGGVSSSFSPVSANDFSFFTTLVGSFVATATTSTVQFSNLSFSDNVDVVIDNVSVSAVPEPQSWALMIGGFGLVGASLRRRRLAIAA